jgi:hypothetical protein
MRRMRAKARQGRNALFYMAQRKLVLVIDVKHGCSLAQINVSKI